MEILAFCPKCARIQIAFTDCTAGSCPDCGATLIKTDVPESDDPKVLTPEWYEFRRKFFKEKIEPFGELDRSSPDFQYVYAKYFGTPEEKQEQEHKLQERVNAKIQASLPHCPVCNSTKLQKISTANKIGSAALFGVFAIGHINKTYRCLNCGYKF